MMLPLVVAVLVHGASARRRYTPCSSLPENEQQPWTVSHSLEFVDNTPEEEVLEYIEDGLGLADYYVSYDYYNDYNDVRWTVVNSSVLFEEAANESLSCFDSCRKWTLRFEAEYNSTPTDAFRVISSHVGEWDGDDLSFGNMNFEYWRFFGATIQTSDTLAVGLAPDDETATNTTILTTTLTALTGTLTTTLALGTRPSAVSSSEASGLSSGEVVVPIAVAVAQTALLFLTCATGMVSLIFQALPKLMLKVHCNEIIPVRLGPLGRR